MTNQQEIDKYLAAHKRFLEGKRKARPEALKDLSGANLSKADLRGADLRGADLSGANLIRADLSDANLRGANLSDANLSRSDLRWADLRGANLIGAKYNLFQVLSASWDKVSDELTIEMMKWDMAACPEPEKFKEWAEGGDCPLVSIERLLLFEERRELFKPGKPKMTLWELWETLADEMGIGI